MKYNIVICNFALTYLILLAVFTGLSTLAYMIPNELIVENVKVSERMLKDEGLSRAVAGIPFYKYDTFTDALMLNITLAADDRSAFEGAMLNPYYYGHDEVIAHYDIGLMLSNGQKDGLVRDSYGRYWQGYLLPLRTLSMWMSLRGIRILNYILLTLLFLISCKVIYHVIGWRVTLIYVLSMLFVNFPMIPGSLQFSSCFYIMTISIILLLSQPIFVRNTACTSLAFFVIGAVTSYFDFLTVPVVTLGIPLALLLFSGRTEFRSKQKAVVVLSLCWFAGYALLWASKWMLVMLTTDYDMLGNAVSAAGYRMSHELPSFTAKFYERYLSLGIIGVVVIAALIIFWIRKYGHFRSSGYLLAIALLTPLWYAVLPNHSIVHFWFTWRALMVPFFCCAVFMMTTYRQSKTGLKSSSAYEKL